MNDLSRSTGVCGRSYDRFVEHQDNSALSKVQQQYWATKQAVFRKLGKKEDEHVVASDFELDTKLELFCAIQYSSCTLQKIVEHYQDKILALSHEENTLGRYLKEHGKTDKTRAGKMMQAVGKTMSYTSQQRLAIRVPLVRLHQEVETFRSRAIEDTLVTVNHMENLRTEYRGALLWMKDISQELDPDTYKQLEKFRKVQIHVRKTKSNFDKLKVDCLQKIDLLAASRCNMFSHALATYQNILLQFWEKSSRTMSAISESFKGYQHYEFNMLKELTEVGKKLVDDSGNLGLKPFMDENGEIDKDRLIFFEEYHDEDPNKKQQDDNDIKSDVSKSDSLQNLFKSAKPNVGSQSTCEKPQAATENGALLLDLSTDAPPQVSSQTVDGQTKQPFKHIPLDLLTSNPEIADSEKDDLTLLNEILSSQTMTVSNDNLDTEWDSVFGGRSVTPSAISDSANKHQLFQEFMPSQLLSMKMTNLNVEDSGLATCESPSKKPMTTKTTPATKSSTSSKMPVSGSSKRTTAKDMSAWFNLFADLDPLANPDALGKSNTGQADDDRYC